MLQVLYIEDDEMDVELTRRALKLGVDGEADVRLDACSDGELALALIARFDQGLAGTLPNIILLDLHLPKVDGWGVLEALKASRVLRSVPVVLLSASTILQDMEKAEALGAAGYRMKPAGLEAYRAMFKSIWEICSNASV